MEDMFHESGVSCARTQAFLQIHLYGLCFCETPRLANKGRGPNIFTLEISYSFALASLLLPPGTSVFSLVNLEL